MKFRKLRMAWSAAWAAVTLLVVVLWVRSYFRYESVSSNLNHPTDSFIAVSTRGQLVFYYIRESGYTGLKWHVAGEPNETIPEIPIFNFEYHKKVPGNRYSGTGASVDAPHWFAVLLCGALASAPWRRWRFTLRTLLIVITLVAMLLGWNIYSRKINELRVIEYFNHWEPGESRG